MTTKTRLRTVFDLTPQELHELREHHFFRHFIDKSAAASCWLQTKRMPIQWSCSPRRNSGWRYQSPFKRNGTTSRSRAPV